MNGDRMRLLRVRLGWSKRQLAERVGRSERAVRRWEDGELRVPVAVGAWLERVAAAVEQITPPPIVALSLRSRAALLEARHQHAA